MIETTLENLTLNITDGKHGDCTGEDNSGFYFISCKDIKDGIINYEDARQITEKDFFDTHKRTMLESDDILITNSGTIGRMAFVKDVPNTYRTTFQKSVAIVKPDKTKILPKYLYYLLRYCVHDFINQSNGSAQKNLLLSTMRNFKIVYHAEESKQKIIADILSNYDNLIENNQKQIKLLEEAAQRLYKEWFIDLHFPGYESTTITDGVPDGWIKSILSEIAYESGNNEKKSNRDNYKSYLPIECIPKKSLGYIQTTDIKLAESSLISFKNSDIIFGAMRPYFHKVVVARENGLTRSTCFVLNSVEKEMWAYLVMLLFSKDTIEYATQISVGTTMPYTRWSDLSNMPIIIPSKETCLKFNEFIVPIIEKINCLCQEIIGLKEARDRLLPKLMSGEIEV